MDAPTQVQDSGTVTSTVEPGVRELLRAMGLSAAHVQCEEIDERTIRVSIEDEQSGRMLIGPKGKHLSALQHIVRCVVRGNIPRGVHILVDVNGYRARREQSLVDLAEQTARKAHRTGRTVALQPMTAVDRRAVHAALADNRDVHTESLGDEPNRRVVVKPVFL